MITINGDQHPWHDELTVARLLEEKRYVFPMIVVKVDGRLVPRSAYPITQVPRGAVVEAIHLISGG